MNIAVRDKGIVKGGQKYPDLRDVIYESFFTLI